MRSAVRSIAIASLALLTATALFSPFLAALCSSGIRLTDLSDAWRDARSPLLSTLSVAWIAFGVAVLLGVSVALSVERASARMRSACWVFALLVLIVPPYIVAESAIVTLGPMGKMSRGLALALGFGPGSDAQSVARYAVPGVVYSKCAVGVVLGSCFFPVVALAVASTIRRTDQRIFEAARLMRGLRGVLAIGLRVFIGPTIGSALLVFALAMTEFAVPQLMRVRGIGELIFEKIETGDLPAAALLSLPILPIVLAAGAGRRDDPVPIPIREPCRIGRRSSEI